MKKILIALLIISLILIVLFRLLLSPKLPIINGYAAHLACSCKYVGQYPLDKIRKEDLNFFPVKYVDLTFDEKQRNVTSRFFGFGKSTAIYKDGLGCMLLKGKDDFLIQRKKQSAKYQQRDTSLLIIEGGKPKSRLQRKIDYANLNKVVESAFDQGDDFEKKTRAVVIFHQDSLIYEKYAPGITEETPLIGWSMTKSVTNALVGILVRQGKLSLEDKFKEDNWNSSVTLNDLLQMNSGVRWVEDYAVISDVTRMLYNSENSSAIFSQQDLEYPPGTYWEYSSGTTNYISGIIKSQFNNRDAYYDFPYRNLFQKIDAPSFVMECDESGDYIMSSYSYATARDWAKLGSLYLNNGSVNNQQIFPDNWVRYSTTPNKQSDNLKYGAHIWLNTNGNYFPDAPHDLYFFSGFQGQVVCMIPSKELIIVRLGLGKDAPFDMNALVSGICGAVE